MMKWLHFAAFTCLGFFLTFGGFTRLHHTWTNVVSSIATGCTSGTTCGPSVTLVSGDLVVAMGSNDNNGTTLSSCCGGGCTWTSDISTKTTAGEIVIEHSTNCAATSTIIGPTWGAACAAGPGCHSGVVEWSSSTGSIAVNGTPVSTATFTWGTPTSLTGLNDVFVSLIVTTGTASGCSGGSSPTCNFDASGNGMGYESNVTGTSYSAPSYTGTSGTNNVGTAAYSEAAGGSTPTGISIQRRYERYDLQ